jgi:hypothetical protein
VILNPTEETTVDGKSKQLPPPDNSRYSDHADVVLRIAAGVVGSISTSQLREFLIKAQHLVDLPAACVPECCTVLLEQTLSLEEVRERVKQARAFLGLPIRPGWYGFLPPARCASRVFAGTDPKTFERLATVVDRVYRQLADEYEAPDLAATWRRWVEENAGGDSWDMEKLRARGLELADVAKGRGSCGC